MDKEFLEIDNNDNNEIKIEDIKLNKDIEIIFMGTPDFAVPILQSLIDNYKVRAVVTQPDKPVGRNGELRETPIKKLAKENMILVLQPQSLKEEWRIVTDLKPDLIVTCAYGQLVPREILVYPRFGCINVHASLLPKLRGGAPIHRAIIEGHKKTGITIMHMNPRLDEGDMISQVEIDILENDTASSLHDKLKNLGSELLIETLPSILDGSANRIPQDSSLATYAFNIKREDERINFSSTKRQILNQVRGLNSWPGAYCIMDDKILKVWECRQTEESYPNMFDGQITRLYEDGIGIKVSNGEVVLTLIQPEGKNKMKTSDFLNGFQNKESLIGKMIK